MTHYIKNAVILMALCFLACGCSLFSGKSGKEKINEGQSTVSVFPEGTEINGWKLQKDYSHCTDVICLASLINGAAPYYINGGAEDILFCDFRKDGSAESISLEVYKTKFISEAKTFFDNASSVTPQSIEGIGEEARVDEGLIGSYRIEAHKKACFVRIISSSKSDSSKDEIIAFAKEVISRIP